MSKDNYMSKHNQINVSEIRGGAFDLDGTLVDSKLDFDAMRADLGFPSNQPILEHLATLTGQRQIEQANEIILAHEMAGAKAASWMPGAQAFVELLHSQQLPMAILTRNIKQATALTLAMPVL